MRRIALDYVAGVRRPAWPGLLVFGASLLLASELWLRYHDAQLDLERRRSAHGHASAERRPLRPAPEDHLDAQVANAEAVVRQLTLPWASLIHAIEQAATRQVALLQLQPDAENRVVRLTAEARHLDAMFEYVRRLAPVEALSEVHIVHHQVQRDDPQHPIQFSVHASLRSGR